jgi:hypothetical protein
MENDKLKIFCIAGEGGLDEEVAIWLEDLWDRRVRGLIAMGVEGILVDGKASMVQVVAERNTSRY